MRKKKSPRDQKSFDDYGFTHDEADVEDVREWVRAAIADGWTQGAYFDSESIDQSCRLERDGFKVSVLTRTNRPGVYPFEASINAWGPDGMVVQVPRPYDGDAIRRGVETCNLCGVFPIQPHRYSFAGRCCDGCLSGARRSYEKPGWDR